MMRLLLSLQAFLFSAMTIHAQTEISGVITDQKGVALVGANIYIRNSYDGGSTKADGSFSFTTKLEGSHVLVLSMIGYQTKELPIDCSEEKLVIEENLKESFNSLKAVEISAGAMEASDEKRSVVFKPLDVVTTAGALGDIVGALNTLPGTAVNGADGRLFVRGGDARETSIFFDGLKVNNAYGSRISGVPTRSRFSPQLFTGTFFSTGGYSAEYGQALSSVLVLNTLDMPLRDQTDLSLMSVGGSVSHTEVLDKDAFTGTLNYTDLTPYQQLVPQNLDWESAPRSLDGEILYRHQFSKRSLVKLFYSRQHSKMELYQPLPGDDSPRQFTGLTNNFQYLNGSWKHSLNDHWMLNTGLSWSGNEDDIQLDGANILVKEKLWHAKLRLGYFPISRLKIYTGVEHFARTYSESLNGLSRESALPLSATFTEAQYHINSRLALRAGLRLESNGNNTHLMPRLSAAYKPGKDQQVSLAYGDFYQQQRTDALIHETLPQAMSRHYILNYQWASDYRTFRVEAFQKNYGQLLTEAGEHLATNGEGYARGFDLFYRDRKSIKNLDFWLTYSYIDSKRRYGSFETQVQPGFAPRHNASVVGKYWVQKLNSQLGASYSFNDGYAYDNPNQAGEQESKTKYYSSLNLNWSYLPRPNLIIHAAINNALGRENIFGYRYSPTPDEAGNHASLAVGQPADRFFFVGIFLTLSKDKKANQLNNL